MEKLPSGNIFRCSENWCMIELVFEWLREVGDRRPGASLKWRVMLVLDVVKGHLTEKVKTLTYNQNTSLEITLGCMSSHWKFLDVMFNRLFKGWLWPVHRMALIWELLTDQPETQEDHLKHCLCSGLGLFGMTFLQNSLSIFKMCCVSSSINGCSIVMSCGKKIMNTTLFQW